MVENIGFLREVQDWPGKTMLPSWRAGDSVSQNVGWDASGGPWQLAFLPAPSPATPAMLHTGSSSSCPSLSGSLLP